MSSSPTPSPPTLSAPTSPISGDEKSDHPPPATRTPSFPTREDCWSEEATRTLIDAWGTHYVDLNRGNLRQKHWQEVAGAVNALHGGSFKFHRTDVQCKNRIDTVKKKYKIEKAKVVQSNGRYASTWPHFDAVDSLIGDAFSKTSNGNGHNKNLRRRVSPVPATHRKTSPPAIYNRELDHRPMVSWSVPVGPRSKRGVPSSVTERNFSVMAAAAAALAAKEDDDDDDDEEEDSGGRFPAIGKKKKVSEEENGSISCEGYRMLADAITRFGRIYERVEAAKQRQMVELEKQRMQFAKDLEIQKMKVFVESQVQMEKVKRVKTSSNSQSNSYV